MNDPASIIHPTNRMVALVTGAASGIGRAFATALAKCGNDVILVDRAAEPLHELGRELNQRYAVRAYDLVVDLADQQAQRTILHHCWKNHQRVGVLVNNAGLGARTPFVRQRRRSIQQLIDVNVNATVALTRLILPHMIRARRGVIINVSSTAAFERMPDWAIYGATKAFTLSFTESLQDELAGTGVFATAVCPGITCTPFLESVGIDRSEVPAALTPEQVVDEVMRGIEHQKPLIVPGLANRMRVMAQRASLRGLLRSIKHRARQLRLIA
jgi:short-subunit dehydrogenase